MEREAGIAPKTLKLEATCSLLSHSRSGLVARLPCPHQVEPLHPRHLGHHQPARRRGIWRSGLQGADVKNIVDAADVGVGQDDVRRDQKQAVVGHPHQAPLGAGRSGIVVNALVRHADDAQVFVAGATGPGRNQQAADKLDDAALPNLGVGGDLEQQDLGRAEGAAQSGREGNHQRFLSCLHVAGIGLPLALALRIDGVAVEVAGLGFGEQ